MIKNIESGENGFGNYINIYVEQTIFRCYNTSYQQAHHLKQLDVFWKTDNFLIYNRLSENFAHPKIQSFH